MLLSSASFLVNRLLLAPVINGAGTTKVKVTGNSETTYTETTYTVIAPKGSIGRLWNVENMTMPINKGLYNTGFIIHLQNE
jgi:hypothetical protein